MTVSVIVPTFNYGRYLPEAVRSVQDQTLRDWECIIVDDASTDDTSRIAESLSRSDRRIRYIRQPRGGVNTARNAGLEAASGEFIQFLDADDLLGPRKLEHHRSLLAANPDVDVVYGDARYFADAAPLNDAAGGRRWLYRPPLERVSGAGHGVVAALLRENIMVVSAPLIRRSLVDRVGLFDTSLSYVEDWEYWLRCALAGARFLHDECDASEYAPQIRLHGESTSRNQLRMHMGAVEVHRRVERALPTPELRRLNARRMNEHVAVVGMLEGMSGQTRSSIRHLAKAGLAERRPKWLAWALLMPILNRRPGSSLLHGWHRMRERLTGQQIRGWHEDSAR